MWPIEEGRLSNITSTWPAISAGSAGPAPLNGTCSMLQPVIVLKSSPERCTDVPLPEDAMFTFPGLDLHQVTNSATLFAGTPGVTTMTFGVRTRPATGAMSVRKLNGRFL